MDITHDLKRKRRKSEPTSEKRSPDNTTDASKEGNGYFADGEWIEMAADLKDMPEIDYNDPEVQKWMEETEIRWKKNNPTLTHDELIEGVEKKVRGGKK